MLHETCYAKCGFMNLVSLLMRYSLQEVMTHCSGPGYGSRSWRCGCLVTWFCYQLIAKPGNKTAAPQWPELYSLWRGLFCVCPANERQCYSVTLSLIGWAHAQNDPCCGGHDVGLVTSHEVLWYLHDKCTGDNAVLLLDKQYMGW